MTWRTIMSVLAELPKDKLCIAFWTFGVAFGVMFWCVVHSIDDQLIDLQKRKVPPQEPAYNTFHFQMFFASGPGAKAILNQWDEEERKLARQSLLFDFAMMPTYAFFFAVIYLLLAKSVDGGWQTLLICFALCPLAAWLCDIVENVMELFLLNTPKDGEPCAVLLAVAGCATTCKWLLLIVPFFVGAGGWLLRLCRRRRS